MQVLLTGSFGFVGSNLLQTIKSAFNCKLIAIDIYESRTHIFDEFYSWDYLDKVDWKKVDIIIHLAGKAHDTSVQTRTDEYFEINTSLTQRIYNFFLGSNAKKFIFFSSVKSVADKVEGEMLTECVLPNPKGPYGESKIAAENYILANLPKKKQVYILRPCMIHGPGNKGNLNLLYKIVAKGIPWPLGAYDNKRSFCSIDNLSFVIHNIIENNIESGIYQVADDEPLSTNELVELIATSIYKKARIWKISRSTIHRLAKSGDILHLPLNTERLRKLTENYVVSNEKLKKALGIEKLPVSVKDGILNTLESFRLK